MKTKEVSIPGLRHLNSIKEAGNIQKELIENWQKIRAVDYVPVVDPALLVLDKLPTDHQTNGMLKILIDAVLECSVRIKGLQLDHAGPIYHGLLESAKYDGSFYTSTAAAVLLANLAMPENWNVVNGEWKNIDKLASLKICDPACGTGTLLMAAAKAVEMRCGKGAVNEDNSILHLYLIENVLHGLDINPHAIHLAASMLTISAPKIDYNKMNLYNVEFGARNGAVRVGSLDILVEDEGYLPGFSPDTGQNRASGDGYQYQTPDIKECDLVIMNPPFTRNSIRYLSLPADVRKEVQERELSIAKEVRDVSHQEAIHPSTIFSFFGPIADKILNKQQGTLAIVQPVSACMGAAAKGYRKLLTDPSKFHVDLVITSHDNNRIYFSENTNIHECLVVASRPRGVAKGRPTAFISLERNPADASEARFLAEAINNTLEGVPVDGEVRRLSDYGTISCKYLEHSDREWNHSCFYNQSLADCYNDLARNSSLSSLRELANVAPAGQAIRGAFDCTEARQNPDMRALWNHDTNRQVKLRTTPDSFIASKKGKEETCRLLWEKRGRLLLANRLWLKSAKITSNFSDKAILGSAFVPASPLQARNAEQICKAWCVWLNSTFGIMCFLNKRSKKLTYPAYSLDSLRSIPVPNPAKCDMGELAKAYDKFAATNLKSFSEIHLDSVRKSLDEAVVLSVPGLKEKGLDEIREAISLEPSVNNKKDPFRLE